MEKVKGVLFPGSPPPADGVPWWMKIGIKAICVLAGLVAMVFGVSACLTVSPVCIVAGIWQISAGFIVIVIEAPFCCMFLDFVESFARLMEDRPAWQKMVLYLVLAAPPVCICTELSTFLGCSAIGGCGAIYGVQVIGTKASAAEMAAAVRGDKEQDEKNIMEDQEDWQDHP